VRSEDDCKNEGINLYSAHRSGDKITHQYKTTTTIIFEYVIFILLIVTKTNDRIM
jgi:hypothetical protein